jgi:hypothetical protein
LNEVITAFVQDTSASERGLFDSDQNGGETVPQELTQLKMGKIVRDRYPELEAEDQEAIRQHAIAALNITQKAKELTATGDTQSGADVIRQTIDVLSEQGHGLITVPREHSVTRWCAQVCDGRPRSRH